jgi:hypothetical protein
MKLRAEHIKLKQPINEATYQDAFSQIKKGDTLVVKTGNQVYDVRVINKFSNQVTFEWDGQYYLITHNSFDGSNLHTQRIITNDEGRTSGTVKGPTVKGVYNIIVKRNGNVVSGVTPSTGRNEPEGKKQKAKKNLAQDRYDDLTNQLKQFDVDDVIEITTGKVITTGKDKGSLAKNTITNIKLKVEKLTKGMVKAKVIEVDGAESSKYEKFKKRPIFISTDSLKPLGEGIGLTFKYKEGEEVKKETIPNVFGLENLGMADPGKPHELSNQEKWDIIKSSPQLRKRYLGNPTLFNQLFRGDKVKPKGDIDRLFRAMGSPVQELKYGDKVWFEYIGKDIDIAKDLQFEKGKEYVGKYLGENKIIVKSSNRKDAVEFKIVGTTDDDDISIVNVKHKYIRQNRPGARELDRAKIKIEKKRDNKNKKFKW